MYLRHFPYFCQHYAITKGMNPIIDWEIKQTVRLSERVIHIPGTFLDRLLQHKTLAHAVVLGTEKCLDHLQKLMVRWWRDRLRVAQLKELTDARGTDIPFLASSTPQSRRRRRSAVCQTAPL